MWATGWWKGSPRGFTLLEILVVMGILALFWASVGLRIGGAAPGEDLRRAGRMLMGEVRELRGRAAATRRDYLLRLDLDAGRCWGVEVAEDGSGETRLLLSPDTKETDDAPEDAATLPEGVQVSDVAVRGRDRVSEGRAEIRFRDNGTVEHAWIHLRSGEDRSITLEIHPVTGQVEVHEGTVEEQAV